MVTVNRHWSLLGPLSCSPPNAEGNIINKSKWKTITSFQTITLHYINPECSNSPNCTASELKRPLISSWSTYTIQMNNYNVENIAVDEIGTNANNHNKYTWQEKIFGTYSFRQSYFLWKGNYKWTPLAWNILKQTNQFEKSMSWVHPRVMSVPLGLLLKPLQGAGFDNHSFTEENRTSESYLASHCILMG